MLEGGKRTSRKKSHRITRTRRGNEGRNEEEREVK